MPSTNPQINVRLSPAEHAKLVEHAEEAGAPTVSHFATGVIRGALVASSLSPRALETAGTLAAKHGITPARAIEAALDLAASLGTLNDWRPGT